MNTPVHTKKTTAAMVNIHINAAEYYQPQSEEKIDAITKALVLAAPAIIENNGTLTRVSDEGIGAVFEHSCEDALLCAFDVFRSAAVSDRQTEQFRIAIGIHYGGVCVTKVRYNDFSTNLAVSDGIRIVRTLSESAVKYDARILITDTAAQRIRSFRSRFSSRKLGVIRTMENGAEEVIFDVFDSDATELKYRKRRSRIIFESGVDMYLDGKYAQARKYFIELLKHDRNDCTAKKYIYMCDNALARHDPHTDSKYLEVWR